MKISVVVTVLNEEGSVARLVDSLQNQTSRFDEMVIIDGGSQDKTVQIVKHYQKKDIRIRLLVEKCSRAKGRNLGIDIARNEIIALTDAGCVVDKNWIKRISRPFINNEVDVVAGFYKMTGSTNFQKALSFFLGTLPSQFDANFLPSTRSVALRKETWLKIGGFPEALRDTAEDTVFNYNLIQEGANIARVKSATVEWGMPDTLKEAFKKIYYYAKGDAKTKIWWDPIKKLSSHNIKALFVLVRYLIAVMAIIFALWNPLLWVLIGIGLIFYIFWAYRKVYFEFGDCKVGSWGVVLQFASDIAVMSGFLTGIVTKR